MKIFCVGHNKTGLTSLGAFLKSLNYKINYQFQAEKKIDLWAKRDFFWLKDYCDLYDAFKDVPFSLPDTYRTCDEIYPDSKFILSIRNEEEWFKSLVRFHEKLLRIKLPCDPSYIKNLKFSKHEKGWFWNCQKHIYLKDNEDDLLYNKKIYINFYNDHNKQVIEYFKGTNKLLIVDVKEKDTAIKICNFLNIKNIKNPLMPHLNKS